MRVIVYSPSFFSLIYHHGQKSWDTFAFPGRFPIHTGPSPPLTPQTILDACVQNNFRVSTLCRVGGGRTARKFRKGCTVLRGNREMTEKYEYCSTVPKTFAQDCSLIITRSVWCSVVLFMLNVPHYYLINSLCLWPTNVTINMLNIQLLFRLIVETTYIICRS